MDSLRGLGALAVVFNHAYGGLRPALTGHGYLDNLDNAISVSVPIFFALSGFLLFRPYLVALVEGRPAPSTKRFFRRRVLRVVPAYWLALTVTGLLVPTATRLVFTSHWWVFYFFGQAFSLPLIHQGLAVAWTLSVDACFYLLVPVLGWLLRRLAVRIGWERAAVCVIAPLLVLGPVVHFLNTFEFGSRGLVLFIQKITYAFPGEANYFAVGMILALLTLRPARPRLADRPALSWVLALTMVALIAAFFGFAHPYGGLSFRVRFVANDFLTMAFVILIMLPAAYDDRTAVPQRILSMRPLLFVGLVSYGLYLWHIPIGIWFVDHVIGGARTWDYVPRILLTYVVVLLPSLAAATLSYYVIELPFLRRK